MFLGIICLYNARLSLYNAARAWVNDAFADGIEARRTLKMVDQNDARSVLEPHHPVLAQIIYGAWDRWKEVQPNLLDDPYKRACRTVVHNIIAESVKKKFGNRSNEGIRVLEEHESVLLSFHDVLVVRFKKLDGALRPSSFPTPRQQDFDMQIPLVGVPDCSRLLVGYVPNAIEDEIVVYVVCSRRGQPLWEYSLPRPESVAITAFPVDDTREQAAEWTFIPKRADQGKATRTQRARG